MTRHSIQRDARGRVANISGNCGSDDCPIEDVDDDGAIEYRCPVTDDVLADEDAVDAPKTPDELRPATVSQLQQDRRHARRRRRR